MLPRFSTKKYSNQELTRRIVEIASYRKQQGRNISDSNTLPCRGENQSLSNLTLINSLIKKKLFLKESYILVQMVAS